MEERKELFKEALPITESPSNSPPIGEDEEMWAEVAKMKPRTRCPSIDTHVTYIINSSTVTNCR